MKIVPSSVVKLVGAALLALFSVESAQSQEHVVCTATLIAYQPKHRFSEQIGNTFRDYLAPLATFVVQDPSPYSGRRIRVIFLSSGDNEALPAAGEEMSGLRYELDLPKDYFDGPDSLIIRNYDLLSITKHGRQQ